MFKNFRLRFSKVSRKGNKQTFIELLRFRKPSLSCYDKIPQTWVILYEHVVLEAEKVKPGGPEFLLCHSMG